MLHTSAETKHSSFPRTGLRSIALAGLLACGLPLAASAQGLDAQGLAALDTAIQPLAPKMVEWRRDIHQHPELSGQEERTAKLVADHLRRLGMEVQTGVGGTGVVGVLRGGQPGKTVALRADMDALPVAEKTGLPFASKAKAQYMGKEVSVMHACGHDAHGHVPSFGAKAMVEAGVLKDVQAIYGLHITANLPSGMVGYRSGPLMAGSDSLSIQVEGRGGHGSSPWNAVDPIVAASQVVLGLQTVVSRQLNISLEPAVLTIGSIQGGTRYNIIPDNVEMQGTLRTFDEDMRQEAHKRITATAEQIAASSGAKAKVRFGPVAYPVTTNPVALTEASLPALKLAMGGKAMVIPKVSGSEDFSEFQKVVPGFFYFLGAPPAGQDFAKAPSNHSPLFDIDEKQLPTGARSLAALAVDYLQRNPSLLDFP
jgi:amidohydrolase